MAQYTIYEEIDTTTSNMISAKLQTIIYAVIFFSIFSLFLFFGYFLPSFSRENKRLLNLKLLVGIVIRKNAARKKLG